MQKLVPEASGISDRILKVIFSLSRYRHESHQQRNHKKQQPAINLKIPVRTCFCKFSCCPQNCFSGDRQLLFSSSARCLFLTFALLLHQKAVWRFKRESRKIPRRRKKRMFKNRNLNRRSFGDSGSRMVFYVFSWCHNISDFAKTGSGTTRRSFST